VPKLKDLGIKVIPDTMRPPEQGGGFGGCGCTLIGGCTGVVSNIVGAPHTIEYACGACSYQPSQIDPRVLCNRCTFPGTVPIDWGRWPTGWPGPTCSDPVNPAVLTNEHIRIMRETLQKQLAAVDEYAKSVAPKTAQEIDARVNVITEELNQLKARRKEVKS
jgi:hypothetical protein